MIWDRSCFYKTFSSVAGKFSNKIGLSPTSADINKSDLMIYKNRNHILAGCCPNIEFLLKASTCGIASLENIFRNVAQGIKKPLQKMISSCKGLILLVVPKPGAAKKIIKTITY